MPLPNPGMSFTPFDPLAASELNDMVENIESLSDGSGIDDLDTSITELSNPYKFSVYRNAAANTGNNVFAKVTFDTEEFDTNNNFATGTYTAPVAGFYLFSWMISVSLAGGSTDSISALYKNGAEFKWGNEVEGQGGTGNCILVEAAANNTFEIYVYGSTTSALNVGNAKYNYFTGFLVSRT